MLEVSTRAVRKRKMALKKRVLSHMCSSQYLGENILSDCPPFTLSDAWGMPCIFGSAFSSSPKEISLWVMCCPWFWVSVFTIANPQTELFRRHVLYLSKNKVVVGSMCFVSHVFLYFLKLVALAYATHLNVYLIFLCDSSIKDMSGSVSDTANVPQLVGFNKFSKDNLCCSLCWLKVKSRGSVPWPASVKVRNCVFILEVVF